ncbi:MAG: hypothetical protein ABEH81_12370 [Halopenitus sp.]
MSSDSFEAGDVFWAPDPFNSGSNPRPWLVLAADSLPYAGGEYVCAGLTLSDLRANVEVKDEDWVVGNDPDLTAYCSPWVLATVKHDAVANTQGSVTDEFTRRVVQESVGYLTSDSDENS